MTRQQRERHKQEVYKQNNKFACLDAFGISLLCPEKKKTEEVNI